MQGWTKKSTVHVSVQNALFCECSLTCVNFEAWFLGFISQQFVETLEGENLYQCKLLLPLAGASAICVGNLFLDWKLFLLLRGVEGCVSCEREDNLLWS